MVILTSAIQGSRFAGMLVAILRDARCAGSSG
jgi:hypothetical protein